MHVKDIWTESRADERVLFLPSLTRTPVLYYSRTAGPVASPSSPLGQAAFVSTLSIAEAVDLCLGS